MSTISGTSGDDTLNSGSRSDTLNGGAGDDTLNGNGGSDTLNGGSGDDTLNGGNGSDTLNGGSGSDTLNGGAGSDELNGGAGNDTLNGGSGNDELSGGSGSDTLYGGDGKDELEGGAGNDVLDGGAGNDEIDGGSGNDLIYGGAGNDDIEGGSGNDLIYGGDGKDEIEGGSGNDMIYGGSGNDELEGDSGNDYMDGGSGRDELEGGSGNDILVGGTGADWLEGGSGSDVFTYLCETDSTVCDWDRILDFKQGRDLIDLSALLDELNLAWGGKTAMAMGAWYQNSGSSTFVLADLNGNGKADFKIELKNTCGLDLTSDDFIGVGVNFAPVADPVSDSVDEDTQLTGQLTASDKEGDDVTFHLVDGPQHGTLTLMDDGSFSYTPAPNYNGPDHFTFRAFDGNSFSDAATVMLTVDPVNDAPEAQGQSGETGEDKDFSGQLVATDVDGDALNYTIVSDVGGVTVNPDGSFTVSTAVHQDLDDGESRDVTFEYVADDGELSSAPAKVTVTILGDNDAPVTSDSLHATNEDMEVTGSVAGSTIDVDGDGLVFDVQGPTPDGLTFNAMTGDWSFDPRVNFNHLDDGETAKVTFGYWADDGDAKSNKSMVTIKIDGVNDAPAANADTHAVAGVNDFGNVLDNDSDPEGHALTFTGFSFTDEEGVTTEGSFDDPLLGEHGFIAFSSDDPGHWSYSAFAGDEGGDDLFEYTISDGRGGTATGTLTVTVPGTGGSSSSITSGGVVEVVNVVESQTEPADDSSSGGSNGAPNGNGTSNSFGANSAPVAVIDNVKWADGGIYGNVLANDSDLDAGDSLIVTEVRGNFVDGDAFVIGDYGFLMITSGGDWTYGLNSAGLAEVVAGSSGAVDVFEYSIQDASGATASSYLAVHVTDGSYML